MVSTRRSQTDNGTYKIGDRVEIMRAGTLDAGIILGPVLEDNEGRDSPSSNSSSGGGYSNHWLVSVDGEEEEMEVSERYLGRVLASTTRRKNAARKGKNVKAAPVAASAKVASVAASAGKKEKASKSTKAAAKESNNNDKKVVVKAVGTKRQRGETDDLLVCDVGEVLKKKPKAPAAPKVQQGETVKIIPMLTGKLYLFRGENPRAEFHWLV